MFLIALAVFVVLLFIAFFFLRTQKDMPKNWEEFVIEFKMQVGGTQALIEDTFLRYKNKVGKYFYNERGRLLMTFKI